VEKGGVRHKHSRATIKRQQQQQQQHMSCGGWTAEET
jgi:hypothetical protein